MADFCAQCANDLDFPNIDLKGITSQEDWKKGKANIVICEGCGYIQVDPEGNCISNSCLKKHGKSMVQ